MKKEYVTPVMECEEFVANEYVAGCFEVECLGKKSWIPYPPVGGSVITEHEAHGVMRLENTPYDTWSFANNDGDPFGTDIFYGIPIREYYMDDKGVKHYDVEVRDITNGGKNPNASV